MPLWGARHNPRADAIFGLMFGYKRVDYQRFVGSLRRTGFAGDVVLAVSRERDMHPGVAAYLRANDVIAYDFGYARAPAKDGARRVGDEAEAPFSLSLAGTHA